jgi:hypothetical protein
MKTFFLSAAALLLVGGGLAPAQAAILSPAQVTSLAYQGYFDASGIEGYGSLVQQVQANELDGQTVVEAAVTAGRLPNSVLSDAGYIHHVDQMLYSLTRDSSR